MYLTGHLGPLAGLCGDIFDHTNVLHALLNGHVWWLSMAAALHMSQSMRLKQSCSASIAPAGQTLTCFTVGFSWSAWDCKQELASPRDGLRSHGGGNMQHWMPFPCPTSLCDLTNALLEEWSNNFHKHTPKPCWKPSQKSWGCYSCKGWTNVILNPMD